MAKCVKYEHQDWTEPESMVGHRLSTNAYYTGEIVGTPLHDAKGKNVAHEVEDSHCHVGTILQDATPGSMPTKKVEP